MGHFQTEIGSFVCTKRQTCLSRLRICKNIGHFRSGSAPIGLKAKAGFGAKSNFASSYQYKLSFLKIAQLWEPIWDPSRPKVAIWFTPKDRSVSLDYEYVKISVTFGLEVLQSV